MQLHLVYPYMSANLVFILICDFLGPSLSVFFWKESRTIASELTVGTRTSITNSYQYDLVLVRSGTFEISRTSYYVVPHTQSFCASGRTLYLVLFRTRSYLVLSCTDILHTICNILSLYTTYHTETAGNTLSFIIYTTCTS